ncbi:unnamed protein product, partial [Amoebophrya sp. A25]
YIDLEHRLKVAVGEAIFDFEQGRVSAGPRTTSGRTAAEQDAAIIVRARDILKKKLESDLKENIQAALARLRSLAQQEQRRASSPSREQALPLRHVAEQFISVEDLEGATISGLRSVLKEWKSQPERRDGQAAVGKRAAPSPSPRGSVTRVPVEPQP